MYQALWCQPSTRIKHAQCKPTGAQCLHFQLRTTCTTIVCLNLQWRTNSAVVLVACNHPSNRAPPCLVPGYHDTSSGLLLKRPAQLGFPFSRLSVVIQIRDLTLSNHVSSWLSFVFHVHDLTLSCSINSLMHPNLSH